MGLFSRIALWFGLRTPQPGQFRVYVDLFFVQYMLEYYWLLIYRGGVPLMPRGVCAVVALAQFNVCETSMQALGIYLEHSH